MLEYDSEKDLFFYIENHEKLVKKYCGYFLVIKNREVISSHKTEKSAIKRGDKKFGENNFLVKQCDLNKWKDIWIISSPLTFN